MANIAHEVIPEAYLHESKGVSSAANGLVYITNGAGSGSFGLPNPKGADTAIIRKIPVATGTGTIAWKHNTGSVHGEVNIIAGAVSTGATGGTITNDADYRVVEAPWTLNPDTYLTTLHANNRAIQVSVTGHYLFSAYISFSSGAVASGTVYALKFRINNSATLSTRRLVTEKVTAGVDHLTVSGTALMLLQAGDYLELMLATSVIDTCVVSDAGMTLVLLHEV